MPIPESVELKIVRAEEHLRSVTDLITSRFDGKPATLTIQPDPHLKIQVDVTIAKNMLKIAPILVGDCLVNLRSALDYLVWELPLAANDKPGKHQSFLICDKPSVFKKHSRSNLKGLTEEMATEVELFQPYHQGQRSRQTCLWILNELANINKHRRILMVDMAANYVVPTGGRVNEYVLATPVNVDGRLAVYLAFKEGEVFNSSPEVTSVLAQLIREVREVVLPSFSRFFS